MNKFFNIILISPDNSPSRQIRVRKSVVIAVLTVCFTLSAIGFYLFFSQNLAEDPSKAQYRKKIARKNLELTQRILSLEESHHKYSKELKTLESKAVETMHAAGVDLKLSPAAAPKEEPRKGKKAPKINNLSDLFARLGPIRSHFDSTLTFMEKNRETLETLPTLMPVKKDSFIIREFGKVRDPFSGKQSYHTGLDFSGSPGDSVFAPGAGIVTSTATDPFYGKTIRISHNNHTESFMAHLQSVEVRTDNKVQKGQFIGTIGSTGKSTGPHLHFEILVHGEKIDPTQIYLFELDQPFLAKAH